MSLNSIIMPDVNESAFFAVHCMYDIKIFATLQAHLLGKPAIGKSYLRKKHPKVPPYLNNQPSSSSDKTLSQLNEPLSIVKDRVFLNDGIIPFSSCSTFSFILVIFFSLFSFLLILNLNFLFSL